MSFDTFVALPLNQSIAGATWDSGDVTWPAATSAVPLIGTGSDAVKGPATGNLFGNYTALAGHTGAAVFFKTGTGLVTDQAAMMVCIDSTGGLDQYMPGSAIRAQVGAYNNLFIRDMATAAEANVTCALASNTEYCLEVYRATAGGTQYHATVYAAAGGVRGTQIATQTLTLATALSGTDKRVFICSTDANSQLVSINRVESVNAAVVADTTAPTLSNPTGAALTPTTASASVTTNESGGTVWCLTNTSATATAAAVKAGGTSQAVAAVGVQNFPNRSGLTAATTYYNHFVQDDGASTPNTSAVVDSAGFTTPATNVAPTTPGTIANITGTAGTAITPVNAAPAFADTDALTYSASPAGTAWPSGLVVNPSTGVISGTIAAASTTTGLKVRATDTASQTVDSNAFSVAIAAAAVTGSITTDVMTSSGTLRASQAFTGTWFLGGVIGSAAGTATHFSGTTLASGAATIANLPKGAGYYMVKFADGGVCYQTGTVA